MPSAKQHLSNIKHGEGIRPNAWVLTFGPPCIYKYYQIEVNSPSTKHRQDTIVIYKAAEDHNEAAATDGAVFCFLTLVCC